MLIRGGGYRVEATTGEEFEREVLNRASKGKSLLPRVDFSGSVRGVIDRDLPRYPDRVVARDLYYFVRRFLNSKKIGGELYFFSAVDTPADQHGTDAFFYLDLDGREYVVTVDLFFSKGGPVLRALRLASPDGFSDFNGTNFYTPQVLREARSALANSYGEFQSALFLQKRGLRGMKLSFRPENHFVLTPFDIERSKGLRVLGREIALFLQRQVKSGPS